MFQVTNTYVANEKKLICSCFFLNSLQILTVGECSGEKVQVAKKKVQQIMMESGEAILYQEPERRVVSRSGDECVVALCDQWYLDYGQKEWKEQAGEVLRGLET